MAVYLSEKMSALLAQVKGGKADADDPGVSQQLGTLKRYGLVSNERDEKGDHWALTDDGKAYLKSPPKPDSEPEGE